MGTTKSNVPQASSLPPKLISSNSPMAQLQALATTWYYKDPQGDIQGNVYYLRFYFLLPFIKCKSRSCVTGPFSSSQMLEWFNAGYFTMGLLVKRACDQEFTPLGELIKRWGQIPFTSSAVRITEILLLFLKRLLICKVLVREL